MKKLLLLAVTASISTSLFAQSAKFEKSTKTTTVDDLSYPMIINGTAAKGTAVGDTFALTHFGSGDTTSIYNYVNDSGYVLGTNAFGQKGYAERYDVNQYDSTMKVIGVFVRFSGRFLPTTTKTISLNVWSQGPKTVAFRPTLFNNGLPATSLASGTVSIAQLGIGVPAETAPDTLKSFLFPTPTAFLTDSFFVGYTINYDWNTLAGDTIGLYSNQDGERSEPGVFVVSTSDTTINNVNAILGSDDVWADLAVRTSFFANLSVFPIVIIGNPTVSVNGIKRNEFTFFGNYPNPANNNTNVKIALARTADVTIDVMDMSGKQVNQITNKSLTAGEHVIEVNTANLAAGEYIYIVRTSNGDGIASKFVVVR
jgi:hypothetical protein